MALTELTIRNAPVRSKAYKLSDGRGLYLLVNPDRTKWWRFRHRFGHKAKAKKGKNQKREKLLSCGVYREVSLSETRRRRDRFREHLRDGIDPATKKRAVKLIAASLVEIIAEEFMDSRENGDPARHPVPQSSPVECPCMEHAG